MVFRVGEVAGPTHMEHVVEAGALVGNIRGGGLAKKGSCEPLDNIFIVRLSGFPQPCVHFIVGEALSTSLVRFLDALYGAPIWLHRFWRVSRSV